MGSSFICRCFSCRKNKNGIAHVIPVDGFPIHKGRQNLMRKLDGRRWPSLENVLELPASDEEFSQSMDNVESHVDRVTNVAEKKARSNNNEAAISRLERFERRVQAAFANVRRMFRENFNWEAIKAKLKEIIEKLKDFFGKKENNPDAEAAGPEVTTTGQQPVAETTHPVDEGGVDIESG